MLLQLLLVMFVIGFQAVSTPADVVDELLAADRAFSKAGTGRTAVETLLPMFAEDVVLPVGAGFVEGSKRAEEALRQNRDTVAGRVEWTPVRGGVSADGQHGFTFGYMTTTKQDGTQVPMKYLAYWIRGTRGWRVVTWRRRPRAEGHVVMDLMPPSVPMRMVAPSSDSNTIDRHRQSLAAAERAFSDEAQKVGLTAAFTRYGHDDAINMGGPKTIGFVIGSAAIGRAAGEGTPTGSSPVSWAADHRVFVASSGDLGVTLGFIRSNEKKEQPPIPFFTVWRRDGPADRWRYIAE
jgi:hypothetical protein